MKIFMITLLGGVALGLSSCADNAPFAESAAAESERQNQGTYPSGPGEEPGGQY